MQKQKQHFARKTNLIWIEISIMQMSESSKTSKEHTSSDGRFYQPGKDSRTKKSSKSRGETKKLEFLGEEWKLNAIECRVIKEWNGAQHAKAQSLQIKPRPIASGRPNADISRGYR
ncbi:hypothetical protein QYF36_026787 [Acer negundo]|nr:hypothetical protein QYF36_026787 [Acer negundo]